MLCSKGPSQQGGALSPKQKTKDHVVSRLSKERFQNDTRLVFACYECNHEKAGLSLEEYRTIRMMRVNICRCKAKMFFPGEKYYMELWGNKNNPLIPKPTKTSSTTLTKLAKA